MADAHAAARDGNVEVLRDNIAAGGDLNQREAQPHPVTCLLLGLGRSVSTWWKASGLTRVAQALICLLRGRRSVCRSCLVLAATRKQLPRMTPAPCSFAAQMGHTAICRLLLNAGKVEWSYFPAHV